MRYNGPYGTLWVAKDQKPFLTDSDDADQPAQAALFAGLSCSLVGNDVHRSAGDSIITTRKHHIPPFFFFFFFFSVLMSQFLLYSFGHARRNKRRLGSACVLGSGYIGTFLDRQCS